MAIGGRMIGRLVLMTIGAEAIAMIGSGAKGRRIGARETRFGEMDKRVMGRGGARVTMLARAFGGEDIPSPRRAR